METRDEFGAGNVNTGDDCVDAIGLQSDSEFSDSNDDEVVTAVDNNDEEVVAAPDGEMCFDFTKEDLDEDDDIYDECIEERDEELFFDIDDTAGFSQRSSYFINNPNDAQFEGFTAKRLEEVRTMISKRGSDRYRCPVKDEVLLNQILTSIEQYLTPDAMRQVYHSFDTNINENLNHMV